MYAIVDDRETQIIKHAKQGPCQPLGMHVERLLLGDVLLCDNSEDNNVLCVVERKRLDDLLTSLHSGHMQEQLERLKESGKEVWILIEHHPGHDDQRGHVLSWMIQILTDVNCCNLRMVATLDVADTWRFICKRASMLGRQDPSCRLSKWAPPKRRHLPVYLKALLSIPSISFKRASAIRTLYPTMVCLCSAVMSRPEATKAELQRLVGKPATENLFDGLTSK